MSKEDRKRREEVSKCKVCGNNYHKLYSSKGDYCSKSCFFIDRKKKAYAKIIDGDSSIQRANYSGVSFKDIMLKEQDNKCAICGNEPTWNNKSIVFILDHIDGNASNNIRSNYRLICPNCDSQLDTYKSKNKNGSRSYYRYKK